MSAAWEFVGWMSVALLLLAWGTYAEHAHHRRRKAGHRKP